MAQGNPFVVLNNATTEFSRNSPHLDEPHASNAERVAGAPIGHCRPDAAVIGGCKNCGGSA